LISAAHRYRSNCFIPDIARRTEFPGSRTSNSSYTDELLTLPLTEIYKARLKLEGIGLLSTLKKELNNKTTYTYELCKPFARKDFFNDAMLSQLLYHHIGHFKYDSLRKHYETVETDRGEEITASFHDVFETFRPTLDTEITVSSANSAKE